MFYYLYEIKNTLNGKIYVGVHKTKNMNDGYMGSGKILLAAIQKYGIENFTKTVLGEFSNSDEMYLREKEIVNEEFLSRDDVYNLMRGGSGGFEYINSKGLNDRTGCVHSDESKSRMGRPKSKEEKQRLSILITGDNNPMKRPEVSKKVAAAITGIAKSTEHRAKISQSLIETKKIKCKMKPGRKYSQPRKMSLLSCPHCGTPGGANVIKRWHFENCKNK
jgi:hypothetical protein